MIPENHLQFLQAVWTRRPTFTYFFFGLNIFIFIVMAFAGGSTNGPTLMAFGVKSNAEIASGQWWRFVTPIFLHIGLLHILFNSYALWVVGPQVEKLYGGARFVIFYVLTGVAGVAASYFYHPENQSAGASGAIFGLFGVLLAFGIRHRRDIPPFFKRAVGTGVLPVILINLVIGFSIAVIDNSAHIGGLLCGMALAAVVPFQRPRSATPVFFTALQFVLLAAIAGSFFEVYRHYDGPRLALQNVYRGWGNLIGSGSSTGEFIEAINLADRAFVHSTRVLDAERKSELPAAIGELGTSIDALKKAPSLSARSDNLMQQLVSVLQDQYELLKDVDKGGPITLLQDRRATQNAKKYRELMDAFNSWVDAEGQRYGIQLRGRR